MFLFSLALVAYFFARGAVTLLAEALTAGGPRRALEGTAPLVRSRAWLDLASLDRLTGTDEAPPPPPERSVTACGAPRRLVGTVVDRRDPSRSFVALVGASGRVELLAVGEAAADIILARVDPDAVLIEQDSESCLVPLFDPAPPPPGTPPPPPVSVLAGIRAIDEHTIEVDRSLATRLVEDPTPVLGEVRAIPHEEAGHVVGHRLYGIRAGGLAHAVGLRNGDTVRAVDGTSVTDPVAVLALADRLRRGMPNGIRLELERRGALFVLELRIP